MNSEKAAEVPLIAILRGVTPQKILDVANVLVTTGFTKIEVPLNSPNALESIRLLINEYGTKNFELGAGTVTRLDLVEQVLDTGANLVVTPNCNVEVIKTAVDAGCVTYPGVITPTEAFNAVHAGATNLKLFPISMVGLGGMSAIKSVLPPNISLFPVGGIDATSESMSPYLSCGAKGFGLGSQLYKPSMALEEVRQKAKMFVKTYKALSSEQGA
ncbi:2-dehydro-3-deoxy-6-phosphogalactonate aldolase [Alteromonas sp. KC3]|uniref:2-dehydro-3-deoxy-6-phosphogalactonate aldolase n=1 Tax=unclassified Alteromonas TaxID=2614992 RepID=UPI001923FC94|nr:MULTISPECIES: 2-dehydro-3-deoxy-6-phosphogalactonate aldolase [unclassified Alteromonas]BCO19675.1 2-dehydro-3-deoxy-6-phosphogalactonate aldolase [Alteromonas sp. KC3]BCO23640.1 2-dehydro-3-deoxy-6-phosphogalactonate aldolase [Alteromonas sp. KC14]